MTRQTDERAKRYTAAKQAAAKWFKAVTMNHVANRRAQDAAAAFEAIVETSESAEEKAFLASLANWSPAAVRGDTAT